MANRPEAVPAPVPVPTQVPVSEPERASTPRPTVPPGPAAAVAAPSAAPPETAPEPAAEADHATGGSFALRLGRVINVALVGRPTRGVLEVDLQHAGIALPGVRLERLDLQMRRGKPQGGTLHGRVEAPFLSGPVTLAVDAAGTVSGSARLQLTVGVLGQQVMEISYAGGQVEGRLQLAGDDIHLPIPSVRIEEGRALVRFAAGTLDGSLAVRFSHAVLGRGDIEATLGPQGVNGKGGFELSVPLLAGSKGQLTLDGGRLATEADLSLAGVGPLLPGLTLSRLAGHVSLAEGKLSGSFGLGAEYAGLAQVSLDDVGIGPKGFLGGRGALVLTAPPFAGTSGTFALTRDGRVTGGVTVRARDIPIPGLGAGAVTVTVHEDGHVDVKGEGKVAFGPLGSGDLTIGYVHRVLSLGVNVALRVPPLGQVTGGLQYGPQGLAGNLAVPVALGPLSGLLIVRYADGAFSGEGTLAYGMDRFQGTVTVRMDAKGALSGDGQATFRIADWLTGTIGLVVHPSLDVDAHGELVLPAEVPLFPPWSAEHSFFDFAQEIPLWAISIPVVGSVGIVADVHASAGFRASFGPAMFRNIKAAGEASTRPGTEPAFSVSGDLTIPAGAEIVLTLGGGIGLSALVAKISGGIDVQGVAGVYGALTLSPTFAYREGRYLLEGTALVEAAAQLRAKVTAYARIVAGFRWLSKEVWGHDWELAEWRFDPGWNAALRATIRHVIGQPFVPQVEFDRPAVDPVAIARNALPQSGQPVAAPARPAVPRAEFRPAEGTTNGATGVAPAAGAAGTATAAAGGAAAGPGRPGRAGGAGLAGGPGVPGAPATAPAPSAGGPATAPTAPTTSASAGAPGTPGAPVPGLAPPRALTITPEKRSPDEAYVAYLYDQAKSVLRAADPTAPPDDELRRQAAAAAALGRRELPRQRPSAGRPLTPEVRSRMERVLGDDLSDVRVHTDEAAGRTADELGARAFTVGSDVYFAAGRSPEAGDERLLAHELVHVVQDRAASGPTLSKPTDDVEKEAEEAAAAVARGEVPAPVRRRPGSAGIRRAGGKGGGTGGGAGGGGGAAEMPAGTEFSEQEWRRLADSPQAQSDKTIKAVLTRLIPKERFGEHPPGEVYDDATDVFRKVPLPMRWPAPFALPHRGVFGDVQIKVGSVLVRAGGKREPDNPEQSKMGTLIRAQSRPRDAQGNPQPGFFTLSEIVLDKETAWTAYTNSPAWKEAAPLPDDEKRFEPQGEKTSQSLHNLTLGRKAFDDAWDETGWRFHPSRSGEGGRWRFAGAAAPTSAPTATTAQADPSQADDQARAGLRRDFEAHHVVPLWLRAVEPEVPSGDVLTNLVPWHRDAHQSNHALQQAIPEEWRKTMDVFGGKTSYLDNRIPGGQRFVVIETGGGTPQPIPPPAVKLVKRDDPAETVPSTDYRWEPAEKAPWMP